MKLTLQMDDTEMSKELRCTAWCHIRHLPLCVGASGSEWDGFWTCYWCHDSSECYRISRRQTSFPPPPTLKSHSATQLSKLLCKAIHRDWAQPINQYECMYDFNNQYSRHRLLRFFVFLLRDKNLIHCGWQNKSCQHWCTVARHPVSLILMEAADVLAPYSATLMTLWLCQIKHGVKWMTMELYPETTRGRAQRGRGTLRTSGWFLPNPAPSLSFFSAQIPGKPCQDVAQY